MGRRRTTSGWIFAALTITGVTLALGGAVWAVGAVSQGYQTAGANFAAGELAAVNGGSDSTIRPASQSTAGNLVGVVSSNPLLTLSDGTNEVQVAISGTTPALVSDINGQVRAGDKITVSPIEGVGMKATTDTQVVGTAQADLNQSTARPQTIADKNGARHTVYVGQVPVQISVAYYVPPTSKFLPPFVQDLANTIAGRPVSLLRIAFAGLLMVGSLVGVSALLYGGVRSGMTSLGRNPLAGVAIRKGLFEMGATALLVLALALIAAYIVLSF